MNNIPSELDWVTERAKCSPDTVLQLLEVQTRADVERRNKLRKATELQYRVEFSMQSGSGTFQVMAHRMGELLDYAIFEKTSDAIHVRYMDGRTLSGKLTLGNDGQCRLSVADFKDWEFWQFRKMALEFMFFNLFSELRQ